MKLVFEPRAYTPEVFMETKLGRIPAVHFLQMALKRDGRTEHLFNADASIDHATRYMFMKGKSKSLRVLLLMIDALGYDLVLVKRKDE